MIILPVHMRKAHVEAPLFRNKRQLMTEDDNLLLPSTPLTYKWLEGVMETECGQRPVITDVSPLGDVLGMMSTLRRVSFQWPKDKDNDILPSSVIIKLPSSAFAFQTMSSIGSEMSEHEAEVQKIMHTTECGVYQYFKTLKEKPISCPTIYAALDLETGTPILVMEDFNDCTLSNVTDGFTEKQIFAIASELARFHAFCFEHPESYTRIKPSEKGKEMYESFNGMLSGITRQLQGSMPEYWKCLSVFMRNTIDIDPLLLTKCTFRYLGQGEGEEEGNSTPTILAHGDIWCPQILWKNEEEAEIGGIIDWQIAHRGSVIEDIARVLATCTKTEIRRHIKDKLFDHYYDVLCSELKKRNVDVPFERSFLDSEYKDIMPYTIAMTVFATAMWANCNVLKKGDGKDQERIMKTFDRTRNFIEDAIDLMEWK